MLKQYCINNCVIIFSILIDRIRKILETIQLHGLKKLRNLRATQQSKITQSFTTKQCNLAHLSLFQLRITIRSSRLCFHFARGVRKEFLSWNMWFISLCALNNVNEWKNINTRKITTVFNRLSVPAWFHSHSHHHRHHRLSKRFLIYQLLVAWLLKYPCVHLLPSDCVWSRCEHWSLFM